MHVSRKAWRQGARAMKAALMLGCAFPGVATAATWQMIVNNGVVAPQSVPQAKTPYFFSYNQPAINYWGQVAFRARAKPLTGGTAAGSQPVRGVYSRLTSSNGLAATAPILIVADNLGTFVPTPNTTGAQFIEFPSTPRIDAKSAFVATRGQSTPVVVLPDGTKTGTSGIYARNAGGNVITPLVTAASQVGSVPAYSYFAVPTEPPGTKFDQFPGSPSPLANSVVAFKGNYTVDTVGKTGVFFRETSGGTQPVKLVVKSGMPIPDASGKVFGSAAPPSAATDSAGIKKVVFAGFDVEEAPTAGGIYITKLDDPSVLTPLASIGSQVPSLPAGTTFNKFGEGISFEGNLVSFWGAWGTETRIVHKDCPTDGNADLIAYCKQQYPNGADLPVPVNQGIFVSNPAIGQTYLIAKTNVDGFTDFLYWTYSGKPPGGDEAEDAEPPRWRSSAFTAISSGALAFKGQKGAVDGLYARHWYSAAVLRVLDTTMDGRSVDPAAPEGSKISAIGLERDGFRGSLISITASMLNPVTTLSWAGIYVAYCGPTCTSW